MTLLYEQYRPRTLDEVVGQPKAVAVVRRLIDNGAGGRAVWISGPSGSGKTTLAKGIVNGLGAAPPEEVYSTTFTLIHDYGEGLVYHIDLYRLDRPEELTTLGLDEIFVSRDVSGGGRPTTPEEQAAGRKPVISAVLARQPAGKLDVAKLAAFPGLQYLGLEDTTDTDAALAQLDKLPRLRRLNLSRSKATAAGRSGQPCRNCRGSWPARRSRPRPP